MGFRRDLPTDLGISTLCLAMCMHKYDESLLSVVNVLVYSMSICL